MAGRVRGDGADDQPVAVLHQRMSHVAEFRFLALTFAIQPRIGIGGRGVRLTAETPGEQPSLVAAWHDAVPVRDARRHYLQSFGAAGNSSRPFASFWFARQDRMGLVMSICIGSAIQLALVVAPLQVTLSLLIGNPMTLVFTNPLDLFAIAGTAFIVNAITTDGETT
jgi:hypothetical protein